MGGGYYEVIQVGATGRSPLHCGAPVCRTTGLVALLGFAGLSG
jgi:hypothetical protein